jgi:V8-like Glu-specific endopeptidase
MLEVQIKIEDELAAKGFKRALKNKAIIDHATFYGNYLAVVWIVVAFADGLMGAGHLIFPHLLVIAGLWLVATAYGYSKWLNQISQIKGWDFYAKLDEQGIITTRENEERMNWNYYKNYVEYEDYLQIETTDGTFTFVPKTPELFEVVEFTKQKIAEK